MKRFVSIIATIVAWVCVAAPAAAQISVNIAGYTVKAGRQEKIGDRHWLLTDTVEIERSDTKLYADEVEFFEDRDEVLARGNVVFNQGNNRIASDSAEFNTRSALGTFHHATGIASVQPPRQQAPQGGIIVPVQPGPNDVYFFGETVQKVASKKYRITKGGFTTCVQPTKRWELSATTVTLNVDDYTLLRQAIFWVKGVPMFYLPIFYYPTQEDGRATGFLLPTYGSSTIRGQSIHNAFFWAINRSQDATIQHDWFSKTGSAVGTEYRYNYGNGNDGAVTSYVLDQREATYNVGSSTQTVPASRSTTINGYASQALPLGLQARARANYFSSIITNQTFNTNPVDAARNNRTYGANIVGAWRAYSLTGTYERNEYFNSTTTSGVNGVSPRITFTRGERPIFGTTPLYVSATADVAHMDRQTKSGDRVQDDRSAGRVDFAPTIRYPFNKLSFLSVTTSAEWRETYYTRSLDNRGVVTDEPLNRQYYTVTSQVIGPLVNKIWDTPNSDYAERFKHLIEPFFIAQRTSAIENRVNIIQFDAIDAPYGQTTSYTYGVNNRIYAKRKIGVSRLTQEIIAVSLVQSYYTDARAAQVDPRYATSYTGATPSNFSPLALTVRATPHEGMNGTMRLEVDSKYKEPRTISASGAYVVGSHAEVSGGWSRKFFIKDLPGFNNPSTLDHYLTSAVTVYSRNNHYGGVYSMNYDVLRSTMLQQRMSAYYNAQCCGLAFEYQKYNLTSATGGLYPSDHRFFLSFTLAGLGSFSPFSGGLGSVPR